MRSYLSLIPISARAHRRQNRMAFQCIVISVFLVTAIFSLSEAGIRMEGGRLIEKHGVQGIMELIEHPYSLSYFLIAAVLFVLVMVAGVLMISGSINSNVAQRVKFFGLLRCLGMSRGQIIRFVKLEALYRCRAAVPLGIALGVSASWALCAVLRFLVGEEFSAIPIFGVSIAGIVSGAVVGVVTVLLASCAPARQAAGISPITAAADAGESIPANGPMNSFPSLKLPICLGIQHAAAIKKSLFLTVASFALSIILFLCFSVIIDLVGCMMPQASNAPDIEIYSGNGSNSIDFAAAERLEAVGGIKRVFGRGSLLSIPAKVGDSEELVDLISFSDYDLDCLRRDKLLKKGGDASLVCGDSDYALAIAEDAYPLDPGAEIELNGESLNIAGLLKYNIFSADGSADGRITLIVSSDTFTRLTGVDGYSLLMLQTTGEAGADIIPEIRAIAGAGNTVIDRRSSSTANTYTAFVFFVYVFLAIIALVTVLNIMNNVSVSVSVRMRQYGIMRAVGMSNSQIGEMIGAEALTYALTGCVAGSAIGLALSKLLYDALITSHYSYALWSFPFVPLLLILLFIFLAVGAAVSEPTKRLRALSITETINEP